MNEFVLAFTLGNAAILTNACLLPLYPGLIAFLAGNADEMGEHHRGYLLGLVVLLGVLTMMVFIGLVLSVLSIGFGDSLPLLLPLVYGVVIVLGVMMLGGRNPFAQMQTFSVPALSNPYGRAYLYGLLFAPMTLPCTGPIILSAFTVGVSVGDIFGGLVYFIFFGLGFGWPLVILPLFALPLQRRVVQGLAGHHDILTRASGILLVAVGIFGIVTELLPHVTPGLMLDTTAQLGYWLVVAFIMVGVGYFFYRRRLG